MRGEEGRRVIDGMVWAGEGVPPRIVGAEAAGGDGKSRELITARRRYDGGYPRRVQHDV
jgi:hypothetical protein